MADSPVPDLEIKSHSGPYTVKFAPLFSGLEGGLKPNEHLIIDERVADLYSEKLSAVLKDDSVLVLAAVETSKSLEKISDYVTHLLQHGVRRDYVLIAVGGGIIQDITAFIAAILLRGISWRFYPTTLLAQADSCIGSKTSINVGPYKNQVGTYTPPSEILVSTDVLRTLSEVDIRSGIGEMIKSHTVSGWPDLRAIARDYERLFSNPEVMTHYIQRSLQIKKMKIEIDEFDRNERLVMNYGHTFGHAIESATDWAVPHGIAVTIGADMANYISWRMDLIDREAYEELHRLLARNYRGFEAISVREPEFFAAIGRDKKNVGQHISLILMRGPGQVFKHQCANDEVFRSRCREYFATELKSKGSEPCRTR